MLQEEHAAMVHCGAKVNDPIEQAVWGPVEVFLDTVFICSVTGIAIVLSGLWSSGLDGAVLTMRAFDSLLPGGIGGFICLASVVLRLLICRCLLFPRILPLSGCFCWGVLFPCSGFL